MEIPLHAGDPPGPRRLRDRPLRGARAREPRLRRARRPGPPRRVRAAGAGARRRRDVPQPVAGGRAGARRRRGRRGVLRRRRRREPRARRRRRGRRRERGGSEGVQGGGGGSHARGRHGVHLPRHAAAVQRHRRDDVDAEHLGRVQVGGVLEGVPRRAPADRGHQAHAGRPDGPRRPGLRERGRERLGDAVAAVRRQDPAKDRRQHDVPSGLLHAEVEPAAGPRDQPPVRGGRRPERGVGDDHRELRLRRAGAVAVHGHRAQQRDGRFLRARGAHAGPPPAGSGELHRSGEAAAVLHDAAHHTQGRSARRRRGRQRRDEHHRDGDPGLPEPLHRRHGPSRRRPAPQSLPQADSERGDVRELHGDRRRGDRAEWRGRRVPGAARAPAAEHELGGRLPVHRAGPAAVGRRVQWRLPREAHRRQRPEEGRQPGRGVVG